MYLPFLSAVLLLRVCADPNNMPFSNRAEQGFENRIARVVADQLHARLEYVWWAQRRNYVRNTLNAGRCDAVIGMPAAVDNALTTHPYYSSTYVFIYRHSGPLHVRSLFDPALRTARVGVEQTDEDYVPPVAALARHGIHPYLVPFSVFGKSGELVDAVARGTVDVGIAWGPWAGYYAARNPQLGVARIAPAQDGPIPFTFPIAAAVRKGNTHLQQELNRALGDRRAKIRRILSDYHVPEAR